MLFKLLALAGLAAAAGTPNTDPIVPVGAQIGALDFGIECQVPIFGNKTFNGYFTATAPIQAYAGQQIYYTDVVAVVTIPLSIVGLAKLIGGATASALVRVALELDNASPAHYDVFPNGLQLNNISVSGDAVLPVRVPVAGTLDPLGPITLGQAGQSHLIHLGDVEIDVTIATKGGFKLLGPLKIQCPSPAIRYDIGIVNVLPSVGAAPAIAPTTHGLYKFANITTAQETGSFRFPYQCAFNGAGALDVDLTITGTVPTYLNPGQVFYANDGYAYLRVPSSLADIIRQGFPTATSIKTSVKEYTISVDNGSPAALNALGSTIVTTAQLPAAGQELDIVIPADSKLKIGPFRAGTAGQELFLNSGNTTGSITFQDASNKALGSLSFLCSPKYASSLIGIPVTTLKAPAISK